MDISLIFPKIPKDSFLVKIMSNSNNSTRETKPGLELKTIIGVLDTVTLVNVVEHVLRNSNL